MKRRVYFFSWLDQRGVWSYKSTLISRKSFLASGISLNLGEVQVKICERLLQALLSSPPTPPSPRPPCSCIPHSCDSLLLAQMESMENKDYFTITS